MLARSIDFLVLLPFGLLNLWSWFQSSYIAAISSIIFSLVGPVYLVVLHVAFGQSVGKMALGLKVEKVDGAPLLWWGACVRFSPLLVSQLAWGIGTAVAIHSLPEGMLISTPYIQRVQLVYSHYPSWAYRCMNLYTWWLVFDVLVLLASRKKQAVHDFMAGTIVRRSMQRVTRQLQAG